MTTSPERVRKRKNYFHVTALKNVDRILEEGLKANEYGAIFLFIDMIVAETITRYQCFLCQQRGLTRNTGNPARFLGH